MKNYVICLFISLISIFGSASAAPENLSPGLVQAYALTQIVRAECVVYEQVNGAYNVLGTLNVSITPVKSLDDLAAQLGARSIRKFKTDPSRTINVQWRFLASNGGELFRGFRAFQLMKIQKGGTTSYEVPWQASWVHLSYLGASQFGGTNTVNSNRTGTSVKPAAVVLTFDTVTVDGVAHFDADNGSLQLLLAPEWDDNPAIETSAATGQITLLARSELGLIPTFVHITTMQDLHEDVSAQVVPYNDNMVIQNVPGEKFIIWFQFNP